MQLVSRNRSHKLDDAARIADVDDAQPVVASGNAVPLHGYVEFYGHHADASGWFVGGWIALPLPAGRQPRSVVAHFDTQVVSSPSLIEFHHRDDVSQHGIGFVVFFTAADPPTAVLLSLRLEFATVSLQLFPTDPVRRLGRDELADELRAVLSGGDPASQRRRMHDMLLYGQNTVPDGGFVDFYGYDATVGGWYFTGWAKHPWDDARPPERIVATFEGGELEGESIGATFSRPDLSGAARGVTFFLAGAAGPPGGLRWISFEADGIRSTLHPADGVQRLQDPELNTRLRQVLGSAPAGGGRDVLGALLLRPCFTGEDTLRSLGEAILLEIDDAILCGADGIALIGWCLAKPDAVRDIRLRSDACNARLDLAAAVPIARPDVLAALGDRHGFDEPRCGFMLYVPLPAGAHGRFHIEVETAGRAIGFVNVPRPRLNGMAAIRRILECADLRYRDLPPAFDRVIGPAVEALNRGRLQQRPVVEAVQFGTPPREPAHSVVVPLFGRIDFVEYQLALFARYPVTAALDLIYVLDDPPLRREAQALLASAFARFGVPLRLLMPERNLGFAPASNLGLAHARGRYVTFLNSDVFPGTPDWRQRLAARLEADPALGVVGPVLLFEDGSVQHQGMSFRRLPEYGGWFFPQHDRKGLRPERAAGLRECLSITGACMMLPRALAERVGGFDETYAIGDFEDSDLCLRLRTFGLRCAIDTEVQLYHLERKSQASAANPWRANLTAYNAWQHDRRWAAAIAASTDAGAGAGPALGLAAGAGA